MIPEGEYHQCPAIGGPGQTLHGCVLPFDHDGAASIEPGPPVTHRCVCGGTWTTTVVP